MALADRLRRVNPELKAQQDEDQRVIDETTKVWAYLRDSRKRLEYEWFINDTYHNNNQFLRYNAGQRRVQNIPLEQSNDKVIINKVKQQVRGIVNFLNAEHPSIGVRPGNQSDGSYLRAKKEKHLCDYWYRHLGLNSVAKKVSQDGAKYGIGWVKVTFDQDALVATEPFKMEDGTERDHTYGEISIGRVDPFEVYPDPLATGKDDMRYIIHAPTRTIAELQANPNYRNTDNLATDSKLSSSVMKTAELRLNMSTANSIATGQANGMDTVVVLEIYRKVFNKDTMKWDIWITTRTESGVLLRNEKWGLDEFPFEYFCTDITGLLSESRGVIHDIREPNRALNEMVSQVHETARIMGKLNWLMPRGSNVNVITDETGQFIEYDITPGGAPRQAEAIGLPSYIMQHINMLNGFMQDISGMHASFNGNAPFAQASGDLVDTLSEGDQNNLTMMRDNYDEFFVRMFKLGLKTAKKNYSTARKFPANKFDAFGEEEWLNIAPADISTSDDLDISTGTQMPYSIAQKQQMYMNLWKEKAIQDPNVLFRLLQMPDIDAAMGDDEPHVQRQLDELKMILDGKTPDDPEIFENHGVHIQTLDKFANSSKWNDLTKDQKLKVRNHRQKHIEFTIQLAQIAAAQQVEPIKRSMTTMLRMNKMSDTTAIERTQMLQKFGVQSDAAQIQLRGGLYIQDPAQAEIQAQNEDIEMMSMRAVQVSFGDNHLVHIQTHSQIMEDPRFETAPEIVQKLIKQHIKDHVDAMNATQVAPGLVPNDQVSMPNQPNLRDVGQPGQMPVSDEKPAGADNSKRAGAPLPPQAAAQKPPIAKPVKKIAPGNPQDPVSNKESNSSIMKPQGGTNGKKKRKAS